MKTKQLLTCALIAVFGLCANNLSAAGSTTSPDTVCAGKSGASYYLTHHAGSSYTWTVPNGTVAYGAGTDSIVVNWANTSGTDTISVIEVNAHGCYGDTQKLAVYRMPLPTAALAGTDSLCFQHTSSFNVSFTGVGPWNFTYSDGTTLTSLTSIASSPYTISTGVLSASKTYSITAISNFFGCVGSTLGSGTHHSVVNPKPATSAIYHN